MKIKGRLPRSKVDTDLSKDDQLGDFDISPPRSERLETEVKTRSRLLYGFVHLHAYVLSVEPSLLGFVAVDPDADTLFDPFLDDEWDCHKPSMDVMGWGSGEKRP